MGFLYRRATIEDIELLTTSRVKVLRAANKLTDDEDMCEVERQSYAYYQRALTDGTHTAYLVFDGECLVGTYHNPDGYKAYIMNMYTAPEYRRRGIAYKTLELLTEDAKKRGITAISLEATEMGRPLYEKFGFVKMNDEMELLG